MESSGQFGLVCEKAIPGNAHFVIALLPWDEDDCCAVGSWKEGVARGRTSGGSVAAAVSPWRETVGIPRDTPKLCHNKVSQSFTPVVPPSVECDSRSSERAGGAWPIVTTCMQLQGAQDQLHIPTPDFPASYSSRQVARLDIRGRGNANRGRRLDSDSRRIQARATIVRENRKIRRCAVSLPHADQPSAASDGTPQAKHHPPARSAASRKH